MPMATATTTTRKVESEKLIRCLTCLLCNDFLTHATTISECLHTFCRDCIYQKISEDDLEHCPVCKTNLGGVPLEKLRADPIMDDLREKIFPSKRMKKKKALKTTVPSLSLPLPSRRKERSLSSLTINEANTAYHSITKTLPKSTAQENLATQQRLSTPIDHRKLIFLPNRQNSTRGVMERETDDSNRKKEANVTSSNYTVAKPKPIQIDDDYWNVQEHAHKPIIERVEGGLISGASGSVKHGKLQDVSRGRRLASTNGSYDQATDEIDTDRRFNTLSNPIWFALVASDHQEGNEPLPQISSNYLRVSNGSIPVSYIQKYLVKKLGLKNEIEVEISLKGQPVSSTLHLHDIVELWRQQTTTKIERIQISVGSSAKDFVMVLSYGRKSRRPGNFPNICAHLRNDVQ